MTASKSETPSVSGLFPAGPCVVPEMVVALVFPGRERSGQAAVSWVSEQETRGGSCTVLYCLTYGCHPSAPATSTAIELQSTLPLVSQTKTLSDLSPSTMATDVSDKNIVRSLSFYRPETDGVSDKNIVRSLSFYDGH